MDGRGFYSLCEYDATVWVKDGAVIEILDGPFGKPVSASNGLPVDRGETVRGDPGLPVENSTRTGVTEAVVHRDKDGNLRSGCAPESIVTYEEIAE